MSFWKKREEKIVNCGSADVYVETPLNDKIVGTAAACERIVSRTVASLDYEIKRTKESAWETTVGLSESLLDRMFTRTFTESMMFIAASISSYGRAVVEFNDGRFNTIDPNLCVYTYASNGTLVSLRDQRTNDEYYKYIFMRMPAPGWPIGRGAIDEVPEAISAEQAAYKGADDLLRNRTIFATVFSVPTGMSQVQLDLIAEKLQSSYSGKGRGKVIAIGADCKVEQLEARLDGILPTETASNTKRVIAMAYGVPYDMIDTEDSNKASVVDASSRYMKFTILPIAWIICDAMNRSGYLNYFGFNSIRPVVTNSTNASTAQ